MHQAFTKHHSANVDTILQFLNDKTVWRKHTHGLSYLEGVPLSIKQMKSCLLQWELKDEYIKDEYYIIVRDDFILKILQNIAKEHLAKQSSHFKIQNSFCGRLFAALGKDKKDKFEIDFLQHILKAANLSAIIAWIHEVTIQQRPQNHLRNPGR